MEISPSTATGGLTTTTDSNIAKDKLDTDYQSFLKLLIAQVSNQDPLEPMDSTTFVSQLAQLTQVEQSIVTNANLEKIDTRLSNVESLSDVQLIGRDVTVPTDRIELRDGQAAFTYALSRDATDVAIRVMTADGTVLREMTGQPGIGGTDHAVTWDGRDVDGLPVPDGVFRVEVLARDSADNAVPYDTSSTTRVEQLSFAGGVTTMLLRNGDTAFAGTVTAVR
ncbi:flagellar hook assembly protein FlgD [Seohaeicola sp.]|jgi:flagellar basal-body rod modification protein FlgD|uniref:flagellar hook assembly protein FlgD n=1 Tax=Seohaeicola sp. TaxID=2042026 RepID=UPI003A878775